MRINNVRIFVSVFHIFIIIIIIMICLFVCLFVFLTLVRFTGSRVNQGSGFPGVGRLIN